MENIRVLVHVPGEGKEAHEYEYCPLSEVRAGARSIKEKPWPDVKTWCRIKNIVCNFGLTEITPPDECPMRSGKFLNEITITFNIVDRENDEKQD